MQFVVNEVVEWRSEEMEITGIERILWIAADESTVVVIDLVEEDALPFAREYNEMQEAFSQGALRKLEQDPYEQLIQFNENYIEKHKVKRDRAWAAICDIVTNEPGIYDEHLRWDMIKEASAKTGHHQKVIYKYVRRFWTRGMVINALLPSYDKCGAFGQERKFTGSIKRGRPRKVAREDPTFAGVNVSELDKKKIKIAIKKWYLTSKKNPLTFVYHEMLREMYSSGAYIKNGTAVPILESSENVISFAQFYYWAQKELKDIESVLTKRLGQRKYDLGHRPLLGSATSRAIGPGAIFEIDATVADVYIVSAFDRTRIIGRPVVYIIKDVFSRLVGGLYVGLEGPSWLGMMMALENASIDKVKFCAQYGITITDADWPCRFVPRSITGDRGELEGFNAEPLISSLGVRVDNTPPYRADLKGIVEQHFAILNRRLGPYVPGAIQKEFRERGEPDYRLSAVLSLQAFTQIIILSILEHNKSVLNDYPLDRNMTMDHVPPIPLELWNWGIANYSGHLQQRPADIVRLSLMPHAEATVTRQGIQFRKFHYGSDVALKEGWYQRAHKGRFRVSISYDPRNASYIYIRRDDGLGFIKCHLLEKYQRFENLPWENVQDQLYVEEVERATLQTEQNQNRAETTAQATDIIQKEKELTKTALDPTASKSSRLKDIRKNRKIEREAIREREAYELGVEVTEEKEKSAEVIAMIEPQETAGAAQVPALEMLRRQREARRKRDE